MRFLGAFLLLLLIAQGAAADRLRMAVTTSFQNSGLSDVLLPHIHRATGVQVQLIVVGTGQALKLGQAGDVDAVLVHSKPAEMAFVAAGHAPHLRTVMYNDFVIIGPKNDPANIRTAPSAAAAFALIAQGHPFISRGDDSGTHQAENTIWESVGIIPQGQWYMQAGSGMGATLNTGLGIGAYVFTDRGSWLNFNNKMDYEILFSGDPILRNQYTFLPINAATHPHVNSTGAARVEKWLTSAQGQAMINAYRLSNQQVFFANAQ